MFFPIGLELPQAPLYARGLEKLLTAALSDILGKRRIGGFAMLALIQRVKNASVAVDGSIIGRIDKGMVVLLGVVKGDCASDASKLAAKLSELRIFEDPGGKMNISIKDCGGAMLAISQFTLAASCKKGRRPSFDEAAPPEDAQPLYDFFCSETEKTGIQVEKGRFASHMELSLINDGPVTILLDSKKM